MSGSNKDNAESGESSGTDALLEKLAQLILTKNQMVAPARHVEGVVAPITVKLNGTNFGLLSHVVEMFVLSKDNLGHLNRKLPQPSADDPTYHKWKINDSIMKGWIINSLTPNLIGNLIRFPTARDIWDAIATIFFDGSDTSQVYDLKNVSRLKHSSGQVEDYYNSLQAL